ncbi:MAG TPA: DUF4129 domain-containing protein [Pyrinomonadaceae bacterium]|jgi:hypothetical protein|nr:DUF4129 domain-containing protein [Pyrinomonadaceae bacterium]
MRFTPRKLSRRLPAVVLLALFVAAPAAWARAPAKRPAEERLTLDHYRANLSTAAGILDTLADEIFSEEKADYAEEEAFGDVRALLPRWRSVEAGGGQTVAANNEWLHAAIDEYQRVSVRKTNDERVALLTNMADRLHALEARLAGEAAAAPRDKDAEKGRLNNILRRPEFDREAKQEGGALQRLLESFVEWVRELLRQILPDVGPVRRRGGGGVAVWAQVLVFLICGAVLAYVILRLWRAWGGRRPKRKKAKREARVVLGERLEADKTAADLLEEAEGLARSGDLRGAIRKAYVALLCELGDRHVIRLAQNKTNRDYLRDVGSAARTRLYTEMLPLTYSFELHWYGLQEASETDWADFRTRCRQALKVTGA